MGRSKRVYDLMMKFWPMLSVAFRLGKQPLLGSLLKPVFSSWGNQATIIPVNETIRGNGSVALPYALLLPMLERTSARFVRTDCMCRQNEDCGTYPHAQGCLFLGDGAAQIHPSMGRLVTVEAALAHVQAGMEAGLVPLIAHTIYDSFLYGIPFRRILTVCFCCDCCCAVRQGLRLGSPAFWDVVQRLPGLTMQVGDGCMACGECLDACPVGAISMNHAKAVIDESCKGCGSCVQVCPGGAIDIRLEEENTMLAQLIARIEGRTVIGPNGRGI